MATVEGYIADKNGVLRITRIHLQYQFKIPSGLKEKAERALAHYANFCPAYQSIKGCIECTWKARIDEE